MNKRMFLISFLTSLLVFLPSGFTWAKTTVWSCKSTNGIGQAYGEGYNLKALFYNMKEI